MFVNTHTLIAKSIVNNIDENKHFFLNENHFIYGNIPHSYRWEFKHSMKKHLSYETELNTIAKETNLNKFIGDDIKYDSFGEFFNSLYTEYQQILDYKNDLLFSVYACNSVVNYILDSILKNTVKSYSISNFI